VPGSDLNNVGTEQWFGRHRLGVIPTSADRTYVFHVMRDADASDNQIHLEWLQEQQALEQFESLDFQDADWLSHPLDERVIDWGVGNRVAIGDAAHAMTPNMGLGAAMAMEDAWTLAELIRRGDTSTPYSDQLRARRHARVQSIQRQSWQIGHMAHLSPGPLRTLRNAALKLTPPALMLHQQRRLMLAYTNQMNVLLA
jgi:2-polyprenyl-6-methoxyphenol hydroxylase-like FAD-dependent oxidoreductase